MARELKDATVRCEFLKKDNKVKTTNLDKALQEATEAQSESREAREEIGRLRLDAGMLGPSGPGTGSRARAAMGGGVGHMAAVGRLRAAAG